MRRPRQLISCLTALLIALTNGAANSVHAGEAAITDVKATQSAPGVWRFDVTVRHDDTGWDHYADKWQVLDLSGKVLGTRVLFHPHVNEQPFTRSLGGVAIPTGTPQVKLRIHDKVHGWAEKTVTVDLLAAPLKE